MAGMIVWHELYTGDVDAAMSFYTELLGADIETASMGEGPDYNMLRKDGRTHAGFVNKEHAETPSHWYPYVHVDDVDGTVEKAKSLGAELHFGPMEISDMLRFAVLGDPEHATFGVMTGSGEGPTGVFAWDELHAKDVDASTAFYGQVAGWTTAPMMEGYLLFNSGETSVGGLTAEEHAPVSYWLTYLAVDDVDAAHAKAKELGASEMMAPEDIEGVGRFSVIADPTGAAVGLFKGAPQD